jgi:hypothetical protein
MFVRDMQVTVLFRDNKRFTREVTLEQGARNAWQKAMTGFGAQFAREGFDIDDVRALVVIGETVSQYEGGEPAEIMGLVG